MLPFGGLRASHDQPAIFGDTEVCIDSEEMLQPFFLCEPPEQVRLFIFLFCVSVAVGLVAHHSSAARYYSWFASAEIEANKHRGLAYNACKAYGIFPIPRLSVTQFHLVGSSLLATLLLSCHSGLAPRFFLFASFGLYFLYFGQLFCESKHGGHGSLLMPSVFLLLALSGGPQSTPWSLVFIKVFLGVVYFAGALSKLVVSFLFRDRWCGSTMQAYLFDGMWSRPSKSALVRNLQHFMMKHWWACSFLALSGLAFELSFLPAVLFGGRLGGAVAACVALSFHLGVEVLQGLDFKPFWCPVLWAFLPDLQALLTGISPGPEEAWSAIMARGFEEEPARFVLSALYVVAQVVVALGFMDVREDKETLPLTCCPMFAVPRNMFGDELRGGVMTDLDLRNGGFIDMAYNFSPWHTVMPVPEEDMKQLPGRFIVWMDTTVVHPIIKHLIREESHGKEMLLGANFEVSAPLRARLQDFLRFLAECSAEDWADPAKVAEALVLQEQCHRLFNEGAPRAAPVEGDSLLQPLLVWSGLLPSKG